MYLFKSIAFYVFYGILKLYRYSIRLVDPIWMHLRYCISHYIIFPDRASIKVYSRRISFLICNTFINMIVPIPPILVTLIARAANVVGYQLDTIHIFYELMLALIFQAIY